ncbi:MAG: MotA/TolQ/ExbB proton channel family protein [Sphingomonadales bacterium]|nr:MotA/TolQ/ExbB proton channel family protein [Sphingomonadales bacterium]
MYALLDAVEAIRIFMERGGWVLWVILIVTFVMWALIIERLWYFRTVFRKERQKAIVAWNDREDAKSWFAHKIRLAIISQIRLDLTQGLPLIKTMVALCPLVGLMGTVTGMITVFDVMAVLGSGNARAMAAGVSKATIPTMAGMVAALSGLFGSTYIERKAEVEAEKLEDSLTLDH